MPGNILVTNVHLFQTNNRYYATIQYAGLHQTQTMSKPIESAKEQDNGVLSHYTTRTGVMIVRHDTDVLHAWVNVLIESMNVQIVCTKYSDILS